MSPRIGAGSDAVGSASRLAGHHSFYLGYAVAICLLLAGWTWFPLLLTVIWALIAGIRLLIRR
jgi:TM2 domain-containing membrane protein YozV